VIIPSAMASFRSSVTFIKISTAAMFWRSFKNSSSIVFSQKMCTDISRNIAQYFINDWSPSMIIVVVVVGRWIHG
jgi:hypothetical protein